MAIPACQLVTVFLRETSEQRRRNSDAWAESVLLCIYGVKLVEVQPAETADSANRPRLGILDGKQKR